ncbi:hypothetical protein GCM10010171_60100 [Actinokineospora fastidiosa]|uniref:Lantibiotic biosynthesis protein dehydration domain-containing protein n=1 Tax=Actinokineospora fastidiosa TaxID=1816 RepID=A0A918GRM9_9PSEU|nr:hypothetical protein GCM10010171_60100 [Actinokineospora fastidiosa]
MQFVESALSQAFSVTQTGDDDPCAPFGRVLSPFVGAAVELLRGKTETLPGIDLPAVLADTAADLTRRLGAISARTFVYEMHSGQSALTGADRFAEFLRGVDLRALLARYPVLARVIARTCMTTVEATAELLTRLAADRAAVVGLVGGDPGPLVGLRAGAGDRHRGGRSATLLAFADGRGVAYQPRPLELHARFGDLVAWLDGHVGLGLRTAACVVRPGYGWVERVEHAPCASAREVELFYRRQGALLALLYALDATDIHYENLIAVGAQPVLVDVETLFHPAFPAPSATGPDPAEAALAASVARTALVPVMAYGEGGALDVSGLGAAGGEYPVPVTRWVDAGTDAMRLERVRVPFTGGAHRPVLDGRPADPADHLPALLSGFRAAYDAIADHAAPYAGLLARCADAETRVVLRHTHRYADLLTDATHPDLLRSHADRDRLFALLRAEPAGVPDVVEHEIAELRAGDVPTFRAKPSSRHIWTGTGACLPYRLPRTGLRAATDKLARMGPVDRRAQEWVIRAAFATRGAPVRHEFVPGQAVEDGEFTADAALAAAVAIAEDIARRAVHGPGRVNWLGVEPMDDRFWTVLPMGAGLLHGYCGVALFLAQAGVLADRPDLRALAADAVAPSAALLDRFAADPGLARMAGGGMAGAGGVGYALARLAVLLDADDLRAAAAASVPVIASATDPDTPSVHDGVAGALLACLAIGTQAALTLADALADRLAALAPATPGFLHGAAGVGHALLAAGRPDGHRFLDAASVADVPDAGWCAGRAGIALACAHAGRPVPFAAPGPSADASPCHGETGVLTALAALAGRAVAARRGAHLLTRTPPGPRGGAPSGIATPGLLTGAAGVGHGLLHLAFPASVPSVLLFAPEERDRHTAKEG